MIVKVCGLNNIGNLREIVQEDIEMIGLNFYESSKRFIGGVSESTCREIYNLDITKVGVFVNAELNYINACNQKYKLDYIQLHGDENPIFCKEAKKLGKVIKVFGVHTHFDFSVTSAFDFCELFLFDTKDKTYGGTGRKFEWDTLAGYKGETPFLLAGGIGPNDVIGLHKLANPKCIGVDINSKFETAPGIKDVSLVKKFCSEYKHSIDELSSK